jgi:hypothetical protein
LVRWLLAFIDVLGVVASFFARVASGFMLNSLVRQMSTTGLRKTIEGFPEEMLSFPQRIGEGP